MRAKSNVASIGRALLVVLGLAVSGRAAVAQPVSRDVSPLDLPRIGYEYEGFEIGQTRVLATLDASAQYDTNLFATSRDKVDDVRFELTPAVRAERRWGGTSLVAEGHATVRRHAQHTREDSEAFGGSARLGHSTASGNALSLALAYDRAVESRADPETRAGPTQPPRRIDSFRGEASYRHRIGRLTATAAGAAEKFDFLDADEADRDMRTLRGSLRLAYQAASSLDVYVDGFVNRRDFRRRTDFSGIDRDTTTIGGHAGVQRELGERLRGRIGVGVFRSNPDSPVLKSFNGVAVDGELTWHPRTRTLLTLELSRGDVATVRSGATGRVDTSARLSLHQEIRHNLLARLSAAYTDRQYRGSAAGHLKSVAGEGELEFLLTRHTSLRAGFAYTDRNADNRDDEFKRTVAFIGLRHKF